MVSCTELKSSGSQSNKNDQSGTYSKYEILAVYVTALWDTIPVYIKYAPKELLPNLYCFMNLENIFFLGIARQETRHFIRERHSDHQTVL